MISPSGLKGKNKSYYYQEYNLLCPFSYSKILLAIMLYTLFCVGFWAIIFSYIFYNIVFLLNYGIDRLQKLHQIPCSKCAYFTGDYRLKCPINPAIALS